MGIAASLSIVRDPSSRWLDRRAIGIIETRPRLSLVHVRCRIPGMNTDVALREDDEVSERPPSRIEGFGERLRVKATLTNQGNQRADSVLPFVCCLLALPRLYASHANHALDRRAKFHNFLQSLFGRR